MDKEFVPYQPSLDMKELGFDEPCLGFYEFGSMDEEWHLRTKYISKNEYNDVIYISKAPLYQQAFRWFREKYNIPCKIEASQKDLTVNKYHYFYQIMTDTHIVGFGIEYDLTYEEAELECLKKLIEIVKRK
jgi:hypothetical protein